MKPVIRYIIGKKEQYKTPPSNGDRKNPELLIDKIQSSKYNGLAQKTKKHIPQSHRNRRKSILGLIRFNIFLSSHIQFQKHAQNKKRDSIKNNVRKIRHFNSFGFSKIQINLSIFELKMTATYHRYNLQFKVPSGTSRGILTSKETWFLKLTANQKIGLGECGLFRGLSVDDRQDYEDKLQWTCNHIHLGLDTLLDELIEFPSIQFGLEMAFKSLDSHNTFELFPSEFTKGNDSIPINGLIWMGDKTYMKQQITDKIQEGFSCIKMKIGAIDFHTEYELLKSIREEFSVKDIVLRVDANGAFVPEEALEKLKRLSELDIHSIEQPIKAKQLDEMARLCEDTPLPIALDEELIGVFNLQEKKELLKAIQPQYIILKPSLVGGFKGSQDWIRLAEAQQCGWWITSALESNIGLNAIAQWTYTLKNPLPQGLGTGGLFTNNFSCPLHVKSGNLHYNPQGDWNYKL